MAGYIKLHRGWRENNVLRTPAKFSEPEAWLWLLENAAWKEITRTGGQGQAVVVPEGHIHTSERALATAWGWDRKRIRRFLGRLISGKMLSRNCPESDPSKDPRKGTSSGSVYRIVNWGKYQKGDDAKGPVKPPEKGPEEDQFGTTQEEGKEGKEEKNTCYAFFGKVIRLNDRDLAEWTRRYSKISDIRAELGSLDDWLNGQDEKTRKRWFHIASASLNKKHQAVGQSESADSMEGFIC